MRKLSALLVLAAAFAQGFAQTAPAPATPAVKKALFWKLSSAKNTVWLLGSIHLGSKDMYPLAKEIEDAYEKSAAVAVEADIRNVDQQKAQAMIFSKGMYSGEDNLWKHVGPETRKAVEQFCEHFSLPAEGFARLKPWVLALAAATIPMMKSGMDPKLGVDYYLLEKAGKKRVVEIESADWQIDLFTGLSDELQEKLLFASVQEAGSMIEKAKRIQQAWVGGDADHTERMLHEDSKMPAEITKVLLFDRNPHMADVAEELLKGKEQAFLVVGAAHMVGKEGVVSLLQRRGYKVEQVDVTQASRPAIQ